MLFSLLIACSTPQPPKEAPKPASSCDLSFDKLAGSQWMNMKPQAAGADKPNPMARVRFQDEGGKLTADYTAGSLNNVYHYACTNDGKLATCVETADYSKGFCRASAAAAPDGKCNVDQVVQASGYTKEQVEKAAAEVDPALAKLKPDEREQWKKDDNNPNNKLRGKFRVAIDLAKCGLTIEDKYQTLYNGKLTEYENVLGTAKFVKADADYTYLACTDSDSSWAPDASDQHQQDWPPGTLKFSAILQKEQKGAASCTYSADIYKDWTRLTTDVQAVNDPKMGPRWNTSIPFSDPGRHVVYFDRFKTCDGKKDEIGVSCVLVNVTGS